MGWLEAPDLHAVLDQIEAKTDGRPMAVMAHSLGAATAILEGADDPRPAAFILEAPFTAIEEIVGRSFRYFTRPPLPAFPFAPLTVRLAEGRVGQHRRAVRPIDAIGGLAPRPVLLVTGSEDPFVLPDDARRMAGAAGPTCMWWQIEGAGHPGSRWDPYLTVAPEYRQRVLALLDSVAPAIEA
jgi:pimeloyl-ACP methyl ester carboxylesterase